MAAGGPLAGRLIGVTADRRSGEQSDLLRRRGAEVLHGPTMVTVDLSASAELEEATRRLVERRPDYFVATTGMGMRMWLAACAGWGLLDDVRAALSGARLVARGAKSASAARAAGFQPWWQAPHETMEEIVDRLASEPLGSATLGLQLFEPAGHPSTDALRAAAGELLELPVYQWALPSDREPARRLVEAAVGGRLDAVTFTSQPAVRQLFTIASEDGQEEPLRRALNERVVAACVGPVCAAAAREVGIARPLWPDPPRLVAMVRQLAEHLEAGHSANGANVDPDTQDW